MLAHVGERLRDDPERLCLHVRIEPRSLDLRRGVHADGELRGLRDACGVVPDRRDEPGCRPDRTAQAEDRLADVDVDGSRSRRELAELDACVVDAARGKEAVDGLRLRVHVAEHLREPVMELARDPFPFADNGKLPQPRLQAGVLQGDRGLSGKR